MRSVNKVILIGYLAVDPELKTTKSGKSVVSFKIATNRDWTTSDGEKHEAVDYHRVVVWQGLAELVSKYLKKGSGVYLEGRIMNHNYKDKEGTERLSTEIVADRINFITYNKKADAEEINLVDVSA